MHDRRVWVRRFPEHTSSCWAGTATRDTGRILRCSAIGAIAEWAHGFRLPMTWRECAARPVAGYDCLELMQTDRAHFCANDGHSWAPFLDSGEIVRLVACWLLSNSMPYAQTPAQLYERRAQFAESCGEPIRIIGRLAAPSC